VRTRADPSLSAAVSARRHIGLARTSVGIMRRSVLAPGQPTAYELADGPKALRELEARATVGKLALLP
jgi:hypothetical protein